MALMDIITDEMIEEAIYSIQSKSFTTLHVIDSLTKSYPMIIDELQQSSGYSWRSIVGRRTRKHSVMTQKFDKVSPAEESPARWRKR